MHCILNFETINQEILTEEIPYPKDNDFRVTMKLMQRPLPLPPVDLGTLDYMGSQIWKLCEMCWNIEPLKRPTVADLHLHHVHIIYLTRNFSFQSICKLGMKEFLDRVPVPVKSGNGWTAFFNPILNQVRDLELVCTLKADR